VLPWLGSFLKEQDVRGAWNSPTRQSSKRKQTTAMEFLAL